MNNQKRDLPPFSSVTSSPSKILNYGFGLLMLISFLLVLGVFFALLFFLPLEQNLIFICFLLTLPITLQVVYLKKTMKCTTTVIDNQGIHYVNKFNDKVEKVIKWDSFEKIDDFKGTIKEISTSSDSDLLNYDVFAKMVGSGKYSHETFFWFVSINGNVEVHKELFSGNHIFSMFYTNRLELVRGLLLGLSHFRPEIKIHPKAYNMYYINPGSFVIEYEKRKEDINSALFIGSLIFIITVFILLFVFF